ncbi:MAG: MarR family transcriptional regulator [Bacteroidetes bacterium]|nr:MarR family transcriptional regulator [Bacteroidota bacterium]MCL5025651.1 MarR family transcriptional regulator [Chloroflexota bacterium]
MALVIAFCYNCSMEKTSDTLLRDTTTLYIRAAGILDPIRLQVWESMGITFPQLRILFRVRSRPGIDVRGLASAFNISPSAVSQQVDKLVGRGLIRRSEDLEDRRHVCLELTDLGQQAVGEISRSTRSHIEAVLSRLSEEELADLHRLLSRVASAAGVEVDLGRR